MSDPLTRLRLTEEDKVALLKQVVAVARVFASGVWKKEVQ